ncbi:hypothetical protein J2741_000017 [Methanolinea mesophila]|nr:hypothetical protein [Methanolinea mesophila]
MQRDPYTPNINSDRRFSGAMVRYRSTGSDETVEHITGA